MKGKLLLLFSLFTLFMGTQAFAGCGDCIGCQPVCCPYGTECECTDRGWRTNTCISPCEYCEAFGNVGGR